MAIPVSDYNPPSINFSRNPKAHDELRQAVSDMGTYLGQLQTSHVNYFRELASVNNNNTQGFGPNIVSATTIQPTTTIHVVTGTATVQTIAIPPGFNGTLYFVAKDGFSIATGGNIAQNATIPATALVVLVYVPQNGLFYITAISIPSGSITTAMLAPGAATEGTPTVDNTVQNITPYDMPVTVISETVTINDVTDFVHITGHIGCTAANAQSNDAGTAYLYRGATLLDTAPLKLTISSATVVGGQGTAAFSHYDSGISGPQTYSIKLQIHNGSGNAIFSVQKDTSTLLVIDHKAQ